MIRFQVIVLCDGEKCFTALDSAPAEQADSHAALVVSLNSGWAIKNGKHLCPKCAVKP